MDETDRQSLKLTVTSPYFACTYTYAMYHDQSRRVLTRHGPHGLIMTHKQQLRECLGQAEALRSPRGPRVGETRAHGCLPVPPPAVDRYRAACQWAPSARRHFYNKSCVSIVQTRQRKRCARPWALRAAYRPGQRKEAPRRRCDSTARRRGELGGGGGTAPGNGGTAGGSGCGCADCSNGSYGDATAPHAGAASLAAVSSSASGGGTASGCGRGNIDSYSSGCVVETRDESTCNVDSERAQVSTAAEATKSPSAEGGKNRVRRGRGAQYVRVVADTERRLRLRDSIRRDRKSLARDSTVRTPTCRTRNKAMRLVQQRRGGIWCRIYTTTTVARRAATHLRVHSQPLPLSHAPETPRLDCC